MAFVINLPRFNGTLSAGVAALSDQGLPPNERLQVPTQRSRDSHTLGVLSAALTMANMNRHAITAENSFLATAAYLAVSTGMVYDMQVGTAHTVKKGSDWTDTGANGPTEANVRTVETLLANANYSGVMTLCLATKYSWWTTNHHVGQGGWSPYVLKVARVLGEGYATDAMKSLIHTAGHWMGTHQGLRYFGIYTPALMSPVVNDPVAPLIADDFVLRQTSFPAGTARVSVVDAGFKLTKSSPLWFLCPKFEHIKENVTWVEDLKRQVEVFKEEATAQNAIAPILSFDLNEEDTELATWVREHSDPRAAYHIGADYLLGRAGARANLNIADALGLVGPVLFFLHPRSTVTKSPHISRPGAGANAPAYESSPTYDEMWNASVMAFSVNQSEVSADDMKALYGAHRGGRVDPTAYIGLQIRLGVTYDDAVRDYRRHERTLIESRINRGEPELEPAAIPPQDAFNPQ